MSNNDSAEMIRSSMIQTAVNEMLLDGSEISDATVAARLPPDFAYDPELDDFRRFAGADVPPQSSGVVGTLQAVETTDVPTAPNDAVDESPAGLRQRHDALEARAAELRAQITKATSDLMRHRAALAQRIADMNHKIGPKITDAQLRRDAIASSQLERAARQAGHDDRPVTSRPGPSQLDRTAFYSGAVGGAHDASDFVRKQIRVGLRGAAYARSKMTQS